MPGSAPTPPPHDSNDDFEPWELDTAAREVAAFNTDGGRFRLNDGDDLLQECLAHWWKQRHRYDETRGANMKTFMKRVIRNKLRDLRREDLAEKRGSGRPDRSLDEPLPSNDGHDYTLADLANDADPDSEPLDRAIRSELGTEILRVTDALTPLQQALVNGLRDGQKVSELSAELHVPPSTLYDEMKRIAAEFEREGLRQFLD